MVRPTSNSYPRSQSRSARTTAATPRALWMTASIFSALGSCSLAGASETAKSCERLQAALMFTQEEAPRDLSSVLPVVVEKINRVLDGVVDVEVEWTGAELHGRVGEHLIETRVTRLTGSGHEPGFDVRKDEFGRDVTSRCFHVPLKITDTDECSLPPDHPMSHTCHSSTECVNTDGSYACACPRLSTSHEGSDLNEWEVAFSSAAKTSCPWLPDTWDCCPRNAHSTEGKRCRERFRCPVDPCGTTGKVIHDCDSSATCVRAESPNGIATEEHNSSGSSSPSAHLYTCQCPEDLMGNGKSCRPGIDPQPKPMVMFDGVTPTALTIKNNFYCGCTRPKIDVCSGFPPCEGKHEVCTVVDEKPKCACRPGYIHHETYGCVDVKPPTLKLRNDRHGDQTLRLKQGDEYREHMVDIVDDNAEDYLRSLKVAYSKPLPPGCLLDVGEFHVNYTVAMPWANPPYVRITRRVIIEDIDECAVLSNTKILKRIEATCPQLIPQCDIEAGAKCINTVGSYACKCPTRTSGDGFLKSAEFDASDTSYPIPSSFKGGTSCTDTSKPEITLKGPNPKTFRIAKYGGGLSGVMNEYSGRGINDRADEKKQISANLEADIREMIRATAGAELCATHENPRVKASDCFKAIDKTYKGDVDLSGRVVIGDPIQRSHLHWVVPYDVKDDAGNEATTVYRDVVLEEVSLFGLEKKIRDEVANEEKRKTKRAIDNAVKAERKKWDAENKAATNRSRRNTASSNDAKSCPACHACSCPETDIPDGTSCSAFCTSLSETCRQLGDDNFVYKLLLVLEDFFPVQLVPMMVLSFVAAVCLYVMRWVLTLIFNPKAHTNYDYGNYNGINDEMVLATAPEPRQQAMPAQTQGAGAGNPASTPRPPTASLSLSGYNGQNGTSGAANGTNGSFFSPGSQMGSPPGRFDGSAGLRSPNTPAQAGFRDQYDGGGSSYQSPPLIVPSKNGEGARRRTPYR